MTNEALRNFQLILLDMLCDFDAFCEENHLEYYLIGGCVLGAVRHKGFIPWDDDVDIGLTRENFEKLEKIINEKMGAKYKYEAVENHSIPNAPIGYLYDISSNEPLSRCPCIDIFALDGVPNGSFKRKIQHFFLLLYHISVYMQPAVNRGKKAETLSKIFIKITPDFMFKFYRKISKKIISRWPTETSENWANLFGMKGYRREIMPKKYLGKPKRIEFEDKLFPAPEQTHKYLTHLYGDYNVLPPIEKRVPEHKDFFV